MRHSTPWKLTVFSQHLGLTVILYFSIFVLIAALDRGTAFAGDNLLQRCWSIDALRGVKSEIRPRRRLRSDVRMDYSDAIVDSLPPVSTQLQGSIRRVKITSGEKLVALTFDLCQAGYEVSGYDGRVIDYLRDHNIKATLFAGGKWLDNHPIRAQQLILDPLFEIGGHGWSHRNLRKSYGAALNREITYMQAAFEHASTELNKLQCVKDIVLEQSSAEQTLSLFSKPALTSPKLKLFRFPFGTCNKASMKAVNQKGMLAIQWDVVTGDPSFSQSARRIAAVIMARTRPGSIIVAHANGRGRHTAKALPIVIPKLLAKGYKFVTVSELLAAGEPEIATTCYENRRGDNKHY